jgi:uracil-DNA glycosylase
MQSGLFEERPKYYASLQELVDVMMQLRDDPLAAEGTNMVIYRGNPEAKLMVIGEAPGPEEDKQGKPFVGRSGQLLDQILQAAGFDSQKDVFITNAVFRLPPGQDGKAVRKPTPEEIEYYRPYILEIVRLIDPKVIVLSGAVAAQSILDEKLGITKIRGKWYEWNGKWVMPIFHPAYLLRNPSRDPGSPKALTWADIKEVRRKYDEVVGKK